MPTPQRLPIVNSDDAVWGDILRQYLMKEHFNDDTDNAANGGHQKITVRAGTTAAGTAPLKFTSGSLMTSPEVGALEFNDDDLYFTVTASTERKVVALIPNATPAAGELFYLDADGNFQSTGAGNDGHVLKTIAGDSYFSGINTYQTIVTKTSDYALSSLDNIVLGDASTGNILFSLPPPSSVPGWRYDVKRIDASANTCTIEVSGGLATIDGQASVTIDVQYLSMAFISNGSAWYII